MKKELINIVEFISKILLTGMVGIGINAWLHEGRTYYEQDKSSEIFLNEEELTNLTKFISELNKTMVELNSSDFKSSITKIKESESSVKQNIREHR